MAGASTSARLDLSVWRNDDTWEFPLRVVGVDLSGDPGVALAMQVRLGPDTPGAPLIDLTKVTNGNAEGLRVAGVAIVDDVPVSDVRIRINKSTRQALPYAGEMGDSTSLSYALLIAGTTRLVGSFIVLAHTYGSDNAPSSRPAGYGSASTATGVSSGATLTISQDGGATLVIDGAGLLGAVLAQAGASAERAEDAAQQAEQLFAYYDRLSDNLFPDVVTFGSGECIVDRTGLLGDGVNAFILPALIEVRKGRTVYTGAPVAPFNDATTARTSVLAGHLVLRALGDPTAPQVIWYDPTNNWYRISDLAGFTASLANDDVGLFSKVCLIAVITADRVFGKVRFRDAGDRIGTNLAAWGADVTQAPYRYASNTVITVTDPVLTGRGVSQAVRGDTGRTTYVGPSAAPAKQGARVFIRGWIVTDEDNQRAPACGINLWAGAPESSAYVGGVTARLERVWSARVASYVAAFPAPAGMGGFSFGVGPDGTSATARQAIAALQYAMGDGPAEWLRWDDFSVPAGANTFVDVDATFPPAIYLRAGRPLDFNPGNALSDLLKMQHFTASVASVGNRAARPLVKTSMDTIELDPARMGATLTVNLQDRRVSGNAVNPWKTQDLAVVIGARTDAQVGLILTDSKGQQSLASDLKAKYEAVAGAGKLTMIGTIPDGDVPSVKTEGHRGWGVADITYEATTYPATALGDRVPGYQQPTNDGVPTTNSFIWPSSSGSYSADVIRNGYAFDLRKYLNAFGFPDPTFVVVELGVNDMGPNQDDAQLAAVLTRNWQTIYKQTRAALPGARIIFAQWSLGHQDFLGVPSSPLLFSRFHRFLIRQQQRFVAGLADANCIFVGMYLHVDRRIDYPAYLTGTDQYGLQTMQAYNALHEGPANRSAGAEAILGAISY